MDVDAKHLPPLSWAIGRALEGLTPKQRSDAADQLDVKPQTLTRWSRGESPKAANMSAVAKWLDIEFEQIAVMALKNDLIRVRRELMSAGKDLPRDFAYLYDQCDPDAI